MMYPPRLSISRKPLLLRPLRPPKVRQNPLKPRLFTHNSQLLLISPPSPRPQLPFLHASSALRPHRPRNGVNLQYELSRLLTTERKKYIKDQVWLATKWTAYGWTAIGLGLIMLFGVQEERVERKFPSPREWTWLSRHAWRCAKGQEVLVTEEFGMTDWANVGSHYKGLVARLENPAKDGAGITETVEGGILVDGIGKTGLDVSGKSEPWRRGYHEALMGAARAAEHLDGWVKDDTRLLVFPPEVVIGPSNPRPKPVPPGVASAPREEDCTPAYESPESIYTKVLTTIGFTTRQRLDAALAYANWLEFKDLPKSAEEMYDWGLDIAISALPPGADNVIDPTTRTIKPDTTPSLTSNILLATTSLAIHHARTTNLSTALPMLLSVLRARRSLPAAPPPILHFSILDDTDPDAPQPSLTSTIISMLRSLIITPRYPPAPPDGNELPKRDGKEICEEAGLMVYIGEILFASKSQSNSTSKPKSTSRSTSPATSQEEDGLAWTRQAVDVAESTFIHPDTDNEGRKRCLECLDVGLGNWRKMVGKLVVAENEERGRRRERSGVGRSRGFGDGHSSEEQGEGPWMREERVVEERMKSVRALLLQRRLNGKGAGDGGMLLFG